MVSFRGLLLRVHLYLGVTVGLLLVSAGLTGSVLVFREEIDALLDAELLHVAPGTARVSLDRVVETVGRAYPGSAPVRVRMPREPGEAYVVTLQGEEGRLVFVDPYRATILGSRLPTETFTGFLFAWHTTLLAGETGEKVMGVTALLLLLLVASGMVVWWPGIRRLGDGFRVKWRANWKRVNFDVHRAGGIWSAAFLVVVAVTGSSLVFHDAYMAGLNWITRSPPRSAVPVVVPRPAVASLPLDTLLARADRAISGGIVTYVTLPGKPEAPLVVRKRLAEELHPNGRNFVHLDPWTGEVLAVEHAFRAPVGTRAYNALYPIHIGRWGGLASRVLHALLGLVPLVLFVSGVLMWWNRTQAPRRRRRDGSGSHRPKPRALRPEAEHLRGRSRPGSDRQPSEL